MITFSSGHLAKQLLDLGTLVWDDVVVLVSGPPDFKKDDIRWGQWHLSRTAL